MLVIWRNNSWAKIKQANLSVKRRMNERNFSI